jgi:hypothetical protein
MFAPDIKQSRYRKLNTNYTCNYRYLKIVQQLLQLFLF